MEEERNKCEGNHSTLPLHGNNNDNDQEGNSKRRVEVSVVVVVAVVVVVVVMVGVMVTAAPFAVIDVSKVVISLICSVDSTRLD